MSNPMMVHAGHSAPAPAASSEPDDSWTKDEIHAYMDAEGIPYTSSMTKAELLATIEHPPPIEL